MFEAPWEKFRAALVTQMSRAPAITVAELTRRLNETHPDITAEQISNWRRGRSRPDLTLLNDIVQAMNRDRPDDSLRPFSIQTLLEDMSVVPRGPVSDDLFGTAYRLTKLQLRLEDAEVELSTSGRRGGAAKIVQRAIDTQDWAVAVTPAMEGPSPQTRMHVADRLTIVRVGGEPTSTNAAADIWADKRMKQAIRGTYAVPSTAGRDVRWNKPPAHAIGKPTQWSISYISSPRSAVAAVPWEGLRSLAFVATSQTSWVKNVASLVALALGYGFTTTSDVAMAATGRAIDRTTHTARASAHRFLISRLPERRIWAHYGLPDEDDRGFGHHRRPDPATAPRFVFLDESDDRLAHAPDEVDELKEARSIYRSQAATFPDTVLQIPCEYVEERTERWAQAFDHALATLEWLRDGPHPVVFPDSKLGAIHEQVRARESAIAIPALKWFADRGWPK
ncbi:hypothetical protein [Microbacterium ureisolvens]|uniref:XRE family transcriptional regulator n=1 Tax=Microbacterium ureisolvens TaxID=2781186 RepID=A0ABS7HXR1_9MICO|nr:hypothetical protein [Microbacterium ureisolvens]MBW9110166.1 hypothetical protein [Microbacterium ureisolvens]